MRTKNIVITLLASFVLLAFASVCAIAAVITVIPNGDKVTNPNGGIQGYDQACTQGWSISTYNLGDGELSPGGPATSESRVLYNGKPFPGGRGAFYATCDFLQGTSAADKNPSTVWLGMDQWKGQPIAGKTIGSITAMNYFSFATRIPQRYAGGIESKSEKEYWVDNTYTKWAYCQQPILLEITADSPDGTERRSFWYRPWGTDYLGIDTGQREGKWELWNCLTQGKWYTPRSNDITADPDSEEFGCVSWTALMSSSLKSLFPTDPSGDTPARLAPFSTWKLAPSYTAPGGIMKSGGWHTSSNPVGNANSNGTGKPINFHVGARYQKADPMWLTGGSVNWVNNTYGFRGQVDSFTLSFSGDITLTYDFEPAATDTMRKIASTEKTIADSIVSKTATQKKNMFKISGKVIRSRQGPIIREGTYQNSYFVIDDGSGLKYNEVYRVSGSWFTLPNQNGAIWVYLAPRADGLDIRDGDYVSAEGYMEKLKWSYNSTSTPYIMWTSPAHVVNYSL